MKYFALTLVASLAAAEDRWVYEERYTSSAAIADVGSTDCTIFVEVVVEEYADVRMVTTDNNVTMEAVLEGAAI